MMIFAWLRLSTDTQSAGLKTHLDLLPVEPRNVGACGKVFTGFRKMKLHRNQ
jgi:hypothetical protein